MDDVLEHDETLSRALVPEVWQVVRREGGGGRHEKERLKFLRIQVLREVAMSARQAIGLEPWGRMRDRLRGLEPGCRGFRSKSRASACRPRNSATASRGPRLSESSSSVARSGARDLTKCWQDGDLEIQQGYLPQWDAGRAPRCAGRQQRRRTRSCSGRPSERHDVRQMAKKWGVAADDAESFIEDLFKFLLDLGLLMPVKLKGAKGRPLPDVTGLYQVDADKLRLQHNQGVWRCRSCRRRTTRRTPHASAWHGAASGELEFMKEDPDNYDLQILDQGYSMLRPEEHTAMVPHDERERLENLFKGDSDVVNTFVCTPTLELGVDIGQLDAILMRNVPPLPANYWQRAGRAGRRHRMAVDVTYCRPVSHDRAYFAEPLKILAGRVDPPPSTCAMTSWSASTRGRRLSRGFSSARGTRARPTGSVGQSRDVLRCLPAQCRRISSRPAAADDAVRPRASREADRIETRDLVELRRARIPAGLAGAGRVGHDTGRAARARAGFASELRTVIARLRTSPNVGDGADSEAQQGSRATRRSRSRGGVALPSV